MAERASFGQPFPGAVDPRIPSSFARTEEVDDEKTKFECKRPGARGGYDSASRTLTFWTRDQGVFWSGWFGTYCGSKNEDIHFGEANFQVVFAGGSGLNGGNITFDCTYLNVS